MGLGFRQGLLQQMAIADRPGSAAMTAPISGEGLDPPAELLGSATDGLISTTGTAMEQQVDRPAASVRWSRAEAMRSWGQERSRPPAATMTTER